MRLNNVFKKLYKISFFRKDHEQTFFQKRFQCDLSLPGGDMSYNSNYITQNHQKLTGGSSKVFAGFRSVRFFLVLFGYL